MINIQKYHFPITILQLLLFVFSVHCNDSENYQNVAKIDMFSIRNVNLSNIADEILSQDWAENPDCLNELNKIRNGLKNSEKWAMKSRLKFRHSNHIKKITVPFCVFSCRCMGEISARYSDWKFF